MCRFKGVDGVCNCKSGDHGKPFACTDENLCTLRQTEAEQARSLHKSWARFSSLPVNKQTMYKNYTMVGGIRGRCKAIIITVGKVSRAL